VKFANRRPSVSHPPCHRGNRRFEQADEDRARPLLLNCHPHRRTRRRPRSRRLLVCSYFCPAPCHWDVTEAPGLDIAKRVTMALTSAPSGGLGRTSGRGLEAPSATSVTNADGAITPTWWPSMAFVYFHVNTMICMSFFSCNPPASLPSHRRHRSGDPGRRVEVSGMAFESVRERSGENLRTACFG
jgi:hypothetical protein